MAHPQPKISAKQAVIAAGVWMLLVLLFASQWYAYDASRGDAAQFSYYLGWSGYMWAILTPSAFWLARRFPITASNWRRRVPFHVVASIALTCVQLSLESYLGWLRHQEHLSATGAFRHYFSQHTQVSLLTYWLVAAAVWFYESREAARRSALRSTQLQAQLSAARLEVLRRQLHPHFLFNTLQAAITLIPEDPDRAEEVLLRLSDLLRVSLHEAATPEISLRRELEILEQYMEIQTCRFQDRLRFDVHADEAARSCLVPSLLLQPLVENAVGHGVGKHKGNDTITIAAARDGGRLRLRISNMTSSLDDTSDQPRSHGVGLASTRERLEQLYGSENSSLRLTRLVPAGVSAEIVIPLRLARAEAAVVDEAGTCLSAR
jgi:two-component system, LytTR family, sensor kinase